MTELQKARQRARSLRGARQWKARMASAAQPVFWLLALAPRGKRPVRLAASTPEAALPLADAALAAWREHGYRGGAELVRGSDPLQAVSVAVYGRC